MAFLEVEFVGVFSRFFEGGLTGTVHYSYLFRVFHFFRPAESERFFRPIMRFTPNRFREKGRKRALFDPFLTLLGGVCPKTPPRCNQSRIYRFFCKTHLKHRLSKLGVFTVTKCQKVGKMGPENGPFFVYGKCA